MKKEHRYLLGVLLLLLIAILTSTAYLFRQRTIDDPRLGRITFKWRWGKAAEVAIDSNSDGLLDFRLLYHRWATDFHTHEPYNEAWESSSCDGHLDRHMLISGMQLERLDYDSDGDGAPDVSLFGTAAMRYFHENPRSSTCGWGPELPMLLPPESKSLSGAAIGAGRDPEHATAFLYIGAATSPPIKASYAIEHRGRSPLKPSEDHCSAVPFEANAATFAPFYPFSFLIPIARNCDALA